MVIVKLWAQTDERQADEFGRSDDIRVSGFRTAADTHVPRGRSVVRRLERPRRVGSGRRRATHTPGPTAQSSFVRVLQKVQLALQFGLDRTPHLLPAERTLGAVQLCQDTGRDRRRGKVNTHDYKWHYYCRY